MHLKSLQNALHGTDPRTRLVRQKLEEVAPRVPRVTLQAAEPLPPGLIVRLGNLAIAEAGFGVPIPLNAGTHLFEITAPGFPAQRHEFTVAEGESRTLSIRLPPRAPRRELVASHPTPPGSLTTAGDSKAAALGTWGILTLGAAGSAIAVGVVTGLAALQSKQTMEANCDRDGCGESGLDAASRGEALAMASTWAFVAGAGLTGVGATFVLLGSSPQREPVASVKAALSPQGVRVSGRF
jgi:hypothetical protein